METIQLISAESLGIDAVSVLVKTIQLISAERKDKLKPAPNEDARSLRDNDHATFNYVFGENISERKGGQLAQNVANNRSTLRHKSSVEVTRTDLMQKLPPVILPLPGL